MARFGGFRTKTARVGPVSCISSPCALRASRALDPNVLILHQPVIATSEQPRGHPESLVSGEDRDRFRRGDAEEPGIKGADVRVAPDGTRALPCLGGDLQHVPPRE